jgi:hypothetical protein
MAKEEGSSLLPGKRYEKAVSFCCSVIVISRSMQNDPVVSKASELLRLQLMPSLEELRGGKVCEPEDWRI